MRRWSLAAVVVAGACSGVLEEKGTDLDVDAGSLSQIPPPPCDQPAALGGDGHHHPGEDCLMCHHQGGMAPPYTLGGTLYQTSGGALPMAGATFHLIDSLGAETIVTTQANGNFWSTDLLTPPIAAFASLCPDVVGMRAPVRETDRSCNASGCHTSGFRLHVP